MLGGALTGHRVLQRATILLTLLLGFTATAHAANDGTTCLQGKNLDEARLEACARYIKSGKARGANLAYAYSARSVVFGQLGAFDRALEEVNEAIRLAQGIVRSRDLAPLLTNRGSIYWKKGDYDRALTELDEAVRLNPKYTEIYYWRGMTYVSKQDYARAIAEYDTAIKRNPKDAEFYLRRCEAYYGKREFDRALTDCNEGLRRDPEKFPWGYTFRGAVYQGMGELEKARADFEHALSIDPALAANASTLLAALSQPGAAQTQTGNNTSPATPPAAPPPVPEAPQAIPATPAATPPAATPPSTNVAEAGGADTSAAPAQGGVRHVLEKFGMLGTWSVDCVKGTSPGATYSVYRALDELRVQRDVIVGRELRPGTVESAVEASPTELVVTWVWEPREVVRLRVDGNRWRQMDSTVDGKKFLADGVYTADSGQPGQSSVWANRCQAPTPAASESAPGSARDVLERYGVFGVWSADCSKPASPSNSYVVYRALDEKLVQYDIMNDPKDRTSALVVETAEAVGPNELTFNRTAHYRDVLRLLVEGKRVRPMEYSRNGTQYVAEGRHLPNNGDPALVGKDTPWVYKCQ